jgi:hypothetical protein
MKVSGAHLQPITKLPVPTHHAKADVSRTPMPRSSTICHHHHRCPTTTSTAHLSLQLRHPPTHPSTCLVNVEEPPLAGLLCPPQSPQPLRPPRQLLANRPLLLTHLLRHRQCSNRLRLLRLRDPVCLDRWLRLLRKSHLRSWTFKPPLHPT